jgi:branched-chain amino acid transport system substrate-binding protein
VNKKMLLLVGIMMVVLAVGVLAVACGETTTDTTAAGGTETTAAGGTETTAAPSAEPIKLGLVADLTGAGAAPCEQMINGVKYGVDEVNAAGGVNGRQVELVIVDTATDVPTAIAVTNKVIEEDHVCAIIGTLGNQFEAAVTPICEAAGVPLVSWATPTIDTMDDEPAPYTFTVGPGPDTSADAILKVAQYAGATKILGAADQVPVFTDMLTLLKTSAPAAGIEITVMPDTWSFMLADYTPVVQKIFDAYDSEKPDLVLPLGISVDTPAIVKGLRGMGVTATIVTSCASAVGAPYFAMGAESMEGCLTWDPGILNPNDLPADYPGKDLMVSYYEGYKAKFGGATPEVAGGQGYDSWLIMLEGLKAGGSDSAAIRDGIEAITNLQTTSGIFTYSPTDHIGIHGGYALWKATNGEFKYVQPLN